MPIMGFTNIYRLQRYKMTKGSECWEISSIDCSNLGELHVHFGEEIDCTLILSQEMPEDQMEHLIDEICDKIFYCSFPEINWTIYHGEKIKG